MQTIRLTTVVEAPVERCFRLSVNVDLQMPSVKASCERKADGTLGGLTGVGDRITWQGWHLGWHWKHVSMIDEWRPCSYFRDVMLEGAFAIFEHEHHFAPMNGGTRMRDEVRFSSPLGVMGKTAETLLVRKYLTKLLRERNATVKRVAESEEWRAYLEGQRGYSVAPRDLRENSGVRQYAAH